MEDLSSKTTDELIEIIDDIIDGYYWPVFKDLEKELRRRLAERDELRARLAKAEALVEAVRRMHRSYLAPVVLDALDGLDDAAAAAAEEERTDG